MRDGILRLVEAFPGLTQARIRRFFGQDVGPYLDALVRDGLLKETTNKTGLSGRPARRFHSERRAEEVVKVSPRHTEAHRTARLKATRLMMSLNDDPATQDVLVELLTAPHLYGAETPLAEIMERCGVDEGGKGWMRPAKKLAEMGVVELRSRKGAGRASTVRLLDVPPYPLG